MLVNKLFISEGKTPASELDLIIKKYLIDIGFEATRRRRYGLMTAFYRRGREYLEYIMGTGDRTFAL
jgi:hypothetical protein